MKRFSLKRGPRRSGGPWMPKVAPQGLNPEQEREMESDDLAELLAATNAKRLARGKRELSVDDVQLRVWSEEQGRRRSSGEG